MIFAMENNETLADLRLQIDAADDKVLAALAERMKVAQKIGELKKQSGGAVLDSSREAQKLIALQEKADGILKPYINKIYSVLFEISRDLQSKL
jgi:chorismate mutase